jgi:outer membrane lipoprotein SlyB
MAWMPFLIGASRDTLPVSSVKSAKPVTSIDAAKLPVKGPARRKVRCGECGWIESIRETRGHGEAVPLIVAGKPVAENQNRTPARSASREITVRLEDGSSRVIVDPNPGRLRLGERVKVIDGLGEPKGRNLSRPGAASPTG